MVDISETGFREVTRLATARERLRDAVPPVERTDRVPLRSAEGRVVADSVVARRDVPHYARAAMDGWAVRAADTFGASDRSPAVLRAGEHADDDAEVAPGEAVRVHTGSELPAGADAVVMVEHADEHAGDIEVFDAVAGGENVAPAGEDVEDDQPLFEPGHRLRPSDLGLLKVAGVREVPVRERPQVAVVPTGDELVERDPRPGEVVETNGLTVSRYVERWGGRATYRDVVPDDPSALRAAIERDLTRDVVVTTGGSSVGERDLVPEVVSELGEVFVHGVALKPGHPVALGRVRETPVLMLPGYPVACIINAVQFLRPAIKWAGDLPRADHPTTAARLGRKIPSDPGVRTFARVELDGPGEDDGGGSDGGEDGHADAGADSGGASDGGDEGDLPVATPTRASGAGVLSSVALADGWVVVPEESEGIPAGERVTVEDWEWYP